MTPTSRDAVIGIEQRGPQPSTDSSVRDAKIDITKKVGMKKKVGRFYGKTESQLVFDPIGEINDPRTIQCSNAVLGWLENFG